MSAELEAREALDWLSLAGLGVGALAESIRQDEGSDLATNNVLGLSFAVEALGDAIKHRAEEAGRALAQARGGQRGSSSGDALDELRKELEALDFTTQTRLRRPFADVMRAMRALRAALAEEQK